VKTRYPVISFIAAILIFSIALPAVADDLDSAVASARGSALSILSGAESIAVASARAQAAAENPFHADLNPLLGICDSVGEVVGVGSNVGRIFEEFAASGSHWSLITAANWTSMGTGQTRGADGYLYVSVVFCEGGVPPATTPMTAATVTTTTVTTPPQPVPTPATATPVEATTTLTWLELDPVDRELCPLITGEAPEGDKSEGFCII
jgi:hypothetical protein